MAGTDFDTDGPNFGQTDEDVSPTANATAFLSMPPAGTSGPKDIAEGTLSIDFEYGSPVAGSTVADDVLTFSIDSTLSAVDAHNSAEQRSDAFVNATGTFTVFIDPGFGGATTGELVGHLDLPALRALATHETSLQMTVSANTTVIGGVSAGGAGSTLDLFAGNGYTIKYGYSARVPFGIDPHFTTLDSVVWRSVALEIPAPGAAGVLVPGLAVAASRRRR